MPSLGFEVSTQFDGRACRAAAIAIAAVLFTGATIGVLVPPAVGFDAAIGFRVWNSMAQGAPVNHSRLVSLTDISQDADQFLATFSPGQYMIPGLLMRMGLSLRWSIWLLTAVLTPVAVAGYYYLYRSAFLFTPGISILSCLAIAVSRQALHGFASYSGGAFLQFAGFPIFLLACLFILRRGGANLCLLPLLFLAGAFLKLSFAVVALSLVVSVWIEQLSLMRSKPSSLWIVRPLATLLGFITFYVTLYTFYTSKGWSAAQFKPGRTLEQFLFCLTYSAAGPMAGMVSMFSPLEHLGVPLSFVMMPAPAALQWFPVLMILATVCVALLCWTYRHSTNSSYRAFLLGFVIVHICSIAWFAAEGFVSLEDRHFWPASAILLPGVLAAVNQSKWRMVKAAAMLIFGVVVAYGISSYAVHVRRGMNSGRSSAFGVTLPGRSQRLIDTIEGLDQQLASGRSVFYFSDPVLAMLVRHHPVLLEPRNYEGTTDRVIIVVDRDPTGKRSAAAATEMFKSYTEWQRTTIDSTDFYYAGKDPLPLLKMTP